MPLTITYHWDFGDGYTSDEEIPTHKWLRAGLYTVTLVVTTELGVSTLTNGVLVIAPSDKAVSEFTLRLAIEKAQGAGWSECEGDSWVSPKADYGILWMIDDNEVPRMLIEDEDDDCVWEEATFDAVIYQDSAYVDKYYDEILRFSGYRWLLSAAGTAEYYLDKPDGGNPYVDAPKKIELDGVEATQGTLGSLAVEEWAYGDNDANGYDTIYIRIIGDLDPDGRAIGYVHGFWWTEIDTEMHFKEDIADPRKQQNKIEVQESHIFTRPQEPENKGDDEFDSNGYRIAQEFSLEVNVDGNLSLPFASIEDIPESGDLVFSGVKVEARRLQFILKSTASQFQLVGRNHTIVAKPKQGSRTERESGSSNRQIILATSLYHISRSSLNPLLERVSGDTIDGDVTQTTGPDGMGESAIILNAPLNLLNDAVVGSYTLFFWRSTAAPVATIPLLPALTQQGVTFDAWQLMYVTGVNCPANLVVTVGTVYDIKLFNGDITDNLASYYADVRYNEEPKIYLPGM